jgi:hypothetical protein
MQRAASVWLRSVVTQRPVRIATIGAGDDPADSVDLSPYLKPTESIQALANETRFTKRELRSLYRQFKDVRF